ncbi:DUF6427 family protein [Flavobacteriaceae bacterium KMM 6897]|nr:DUF6427 family protein [Flavobacteriaceae bacterium KMM 6897]
MISSIFGKTKPINYIILLVFLFLFYWSAHLFLFVQTELSQELLYKMGFLVLLMFSIFLVDFILKRNKLTKTNSFAILFFTMLMVVFPEVLRDENAIWCNLFLLLAARRLLSIKSMKNIKVKIYDASLWIVVASLFYDWAILYILLVFIAIYLYDPKNGRNWLVPFTGFFTVAMISYAILLLANNPGFLEKHYQFNFEFNVAYFTHFGNSIKLVVYILMTAIAGLVAFVKLRSSGSGKIITMRLIALYFFISMITVVLISADNTYPVLMTFFPAVIFFTHYIESIKKPNMKEMVLIAAVIVPFLIFFGNILNK